MLVPSECASHMGSFSHWCGLSPSDRSKHGVSTLKQLKCVVYGIEADKFNDFWISTNANPLVCVLSLWRIEWVKIVAVLLLGFITSSRVNKAK
ncbi:hypothetical protein YC2023_012481 [Brassica napus]